MSIFQCCACGCAENSACTGGYWGTELIAKNPEALASYRQILGLKEDEPYGRYCSVCDPSWFTEKGDYGVGPRPVGYVGRSENHSGKWHGRFERMFLPKGMFHTNEEGNLAHVLTLESPRKYALESEDHPGLRTRPLNGRLPKLGTPEAERYLKKMTKHTHTSSCGHSRPRSTTAAAMTLAAAALSDHIPAAKVEAPPTPEELAAAEARSKVKIAKAEEKRRRKAEKRGKHG